MLETTSKLTKSLILVVFTILLLVVNYYFASRGIDLTDQAYLLSIADTWYDPIHFPICGSVVLVKFIKELFTDDALLITKLLAQLQPFVILLFFLLCLRKSIPVNFVTTLVLLFLTFWMGRSVLAEWTYYSTISGLLISFIIILFTKSLLEQNSSSFVVGLLLLILAILVKITNIIFLGLLPIYLYFLYRGNVTKNFRAKIIQLLVIAIVLCLISIICISQTAVENYILIGFTKLNEFSETSQIHSTARLFQIIINDLKLYSINGLYFLIFASCLYCTTREKSKISLTLRSLIVLGFLYFQYILNLFEWNALFLVYLIFLLVALVNKQSKNLKFLASATIYFLCANSLGSGNGLKASFIAEPLVCIVLVVFVFNSQLSARLKSTALILTLVLSLIGLQHKFLGTYRDLDKFSLNMPSSIPKLKGLYSHSSKISTLESLYKIRTESFPFAKTAIIYPSAPLLYYLLDLKPITSNTWTNLQPASQLEEIFNSMTNETLPNIIIRLKQNPRKKEWPDNLQLIEKDQNFESINLIDQFTAKSNYKKIYSTEFYDFFSR